MTTSHASLMPAKPLLGGCPLLPASYYCKIFVRQDGISDPNQETHLLTADFWGRALQNQSHGIQWTFNVWHLIFFFPSFSSRHLTTGLKDEWLLFLSILTSPQIPIYYWPTVWGLPSCCQSTYNIVKSKTLWQTKIIMTDGRIRCYRSWCDDTIFSISRQSGARPK